MARRSMRARAVGGKGGSLPPRSALRSSDGMVLLETALAIPLLVAVTVALAWGISLAATSLALGDAARTAARDLARGEPSAQVLSRAQQAVPDARVSVADAGDSVAVVIDQDVHAPVPILSGVSVTLTSRVAIPREWT
jgi:Flp pilus assembly protein TadG